jgi:hypothetical protein
VSECRRLSVKYDRSDSFTRDLPCEAVRHQPER